MSTFRPLVWRHSVTVASTISLRDVKINCDSAVCLLNEEERQVG